MSAPRVLQPSFSRGEITPLLYPRVDLSVYQIGLAELKNAYVLPTGAVTRRPGFKYVGRPLSYTSASCPARLIPFVYNSNDAMMIELSNGRARLWSSNGTLSPTTSTTYSSPYTADELPYITYAQSGNVIFMAHKNHPVYLFKRVLASNGSPALEITPLEYRYGPWLTELPDEGLAMRLNSSGTRITVSKPSDTSFAGYFNSGMVNKLIELNYSTGQRYVTEYEDDPLIVDGETWYVSRSVEVGGQYHIQTHDNWTGKVILERSYDNGVTWVDAVSMYDRTDAGAQGNWDISRVEDEKNVIYRFRSSSKEIKFTLSVSSFTKTFIYKINRVIDAYTVTATWQRDRNEVASAPPIDDTTFDWRLGAWGGADGYPSVVTFFQGRLVLASSKGEPQTVWMSRVNDFADFGTSMEIQDDDSINVTLSAPDADGIVGIDALDDLLVRTASGEWRMKGAGDYGAITPTAIVAHRQATEIGSGQVKSIITGGGVVFAQTHRKSIYAFGYDLSSDGYRGNELSVMSNHLFKDRRITQIAWQQEPNKLIWMTLDDGTMTSCSFDPSQQINGWARHVTDGFIGDIAVIPQSEYDELWALIKRGSEWRIERMASHKERCFTDGDSKYETCVKTLRINYSSQGSVISKMKFDARCIVYTYESEQAFISPADDRARAKRIAWENKSTMVETDVQMDNGFRKDAGVEIWTDENVPLTILAISPTLTAGG